MYLVRDDCCSLRLSAVQRFCAVRELTNADFVLVSFSLREVTTNFIFICSQSHMYGERGNRNVTSGVEFAMRTRIYARKFPA